MEIRITSDDLLTVPESARQIGRPKMTIYRWIKAGKIVGIKLGGIMFIPTSEVVRIKNKQATIV